ncbi:MAG: tetratricopeptide repeat protein [Crocinitomicaceae bacterium]
MKRFLSLLLIFPFIGFSQLSPEQELKVDSLQKVIKTAKHDTTRINATFAWDDIIYFTDPDLDLQLNLEIDSICSSNLKKTPSTHEKGHFLKSKGRALNNIGIIFYDRGDYAKAINYFDGSIKASTKVGDKKGIARAEVNIGNIRLRQVEYEKALKSFKNSMEIFEELDVKGGLANSLENIGLSYSEMKEYEKSRDYYDRSLKLYEEIGDKKGRANVFSNIAELYRSLGDTLKSMEYHSKSLSIREEIGDKIGIPMSLNQIGKRLVELGNYSEALKMLKRSLAISQENGLNRTIQVASQYLSKIYKNQGDFKKSLEMFELYTFTKEKIESEENQKAVIQQEYRFAYEKQAAQDSVKALEANKVKDALLATEKAENERNQQKQYFLYVGLALAILFGVLIFNRFKVANKQKAIIEKQKLVVDEAFDELEEAHKEITDSINYAERIQRSFLATKDLLDEQLKEHFVFFQPKDVVSGDFYWASQLSNGHFAIVNADSTGHGVPGAIMSILNISSIESAVKDKLIEPAAIFNDARKTIIERLKKDGSEEGGKDGMDASMICFNQKKTKMSYVAAQNPIWIIRENELIQIKPEKMPIGKHDKENVPFTGGEFDLQQGDQVYTLTDGFQDQFGGPKGKKFMIKKMREFVLSISHLPMEKQHEQLKATLANWMGDQEQVDDICVVGIKI